MTSIHFDDFEIISPCVERDESAGKSSPQDLCVAPSVYTTEIDDEFVEVVLNTPNTLPSCQEEGFPSNTVLLLGKKSTAQAVSARYSLTSVIRIPSKGCKMYEASPTSWIRCILHAALEPRQSAAHLELEEYDKPASTPNRTSIAANSMRDPVQKVVIYRSTSHGSGSFLARADTASEYIWLD